MANVYLKYYLSPGLKIETMFLGNFDNYWRIYMAPKTCRTTFIILITVKTSNTPFGKLICPRVGLLLSLWRTQLLCFLSVITFIAHLLMYFNLVKNRTYRIVLNCFPAIYPSARRYQKHNDLKVVLLCSSGERRPKY